MSKLILRGDTRKNFGEYLPTPSIEKVKVFNGKLIVQLGLYITMAEDEDEDTLKERLAELSYYLFLVISSDYAEEIIQKTGNNIFSYLHATNYVAGAHSGWEELGYRMIDVAGEYQQLSFSEFTATDNYLYDEAGNRILKMLAEVTLSETLSDIADLYADMGQTNVIESWNDLNSLTVFAFSSTLDYSDSSTDIEEEQENPVLLNQNVSEISYEVVIEDYELAGQAEIIWVDKERDPFDGVPLQSIMSQYYTPDGITHQDITESFNDLLEEYQTKAKTDTVLESVVDSVSFVLEKYGTEPDLVPRLNVVRKAWPQKLVTTPSGQLYMRFNRKLFNANKAVRKGRLLHKELVLNPKIIDLREPAAIEQYEVQPGSYDGLEFEEGTFLYEKWNMTSMALRSTEATELEYVTGSYESDYLMNAGFFYFDYEKLMHTGSNLAGVVDVSKIESFFGKEITNSKLTVDDVMLKRKWREGYYDEDIEIMMYGVLDSNPSMDFVIPADYNGSLAVSLELVDGTTEESYLVLRNFAFPDQEEDSYRLMCFEFQDIHRMPYSSHVQSEFLENGAGPHYQEYVTTVGVTDNTLDVIKAITASYISFMTGAMQEYYDVAAENCSYNNIDGVFNKFFVDNITTAWSDNLDEAPWVKGPVLYNMHRDLLFDTFSGSVADIIDDSKKISDRIGPYAGTLEQLESFLEQFNNLYLYQYWENGSSNVQLHVDYWNDSGTIDKEYEITFTDFPLIYNETLATEYENEEILQEIIADLQAEIDYQEELLATIQDKLPTFYSDSWESLFNLYANETMTGEATSEKWSDQQDSNPDMLPAHAGKDDSGSDSVTVATRIMVTQGVDAAREFLTDWTAGWQNSTKENTNRGAASIGFVFQALYWYTNYLMSYLHLLGYDEENDYVLNYAEYMPDGMYEKITDWSSYHGWFEIWPGEDVPDSALRTEVNNFLELMDGLEDAGLWPMPTEISYYYQHLLDDFEVPTDMNYVSA